MDGTRSTFLSSPIGLRGLLCSCVMLALLFGQPTRAEVPPLLQVEGFAQPLNMVPSSETPSGKPAATPRRENVRPHIVRPPARVIRIQRPTLPMSQPTTVRPRPRVIKMDVAPTVAMLPETTDVNAGDSISALTHPAVKNVDAPPTNHRVSVHRATVEEALQSRGSITFRKTALSEVVFLLSDLWHINIVAGENVSGEVSGAFHDAPLSEVLSGGADGDRVRLPSDRKQSDRAAD